MDVLTSEGAGILKTAGAISHPALRAQKPLFVHRRQVFRVAELGVHGMMMVCLERVRLCMNANF